ncbi:hypothetical protein [uncultured Roseobacter sp.]|uniref:hypothetical protein n=1 Tax=uncultured Roseobacter sp. TaxID=114847 RepID=UPI0026214F3F|nr:hypothetical protein [uncultured Roseobacter sp.]
MTQAYPLQWPTGRPRTKTRVKSKFRVKPATAYSEMMSELSRFDVQNVVVSSNIPLRRDGTPYRDGLTDPLEDPGVCVFFIRKKRQVSIPCDTFKYPWENIRAIGTAVECFRTMERMGATQVLDQAFEGFTALPPPDAEFESDEAWWTVLGVSTAADMVEVKKAFKQRYEDASRRGDTELQRKLLWAKEQAGV